MSELTPLTVEELRGTAIKSRFDGLMLARSAFNVLSAALGIPADAAWEQTDRGLWEKVASWAINFIEHAAAIKQDVALDEFANKIAGYMGSQYATQTTEERIAWASIARLWGNAVKSLDGDLLDIERECVGWALRKIEQSKPVPPPEVKPKAVDIDVVAQNLYESMAKKPATNGHVATSGYAQTVVVTKPATGFDQVIDLQIADYEAKIAGLRELKRQLAPNTQAALYDLLRNLTQGE